MRRLGGVPEWPNGTALKAVAGSDVSRGFESRPLCVTVYRYDRGRATLFAGQCVVVAAIGVIVAVLLAGIDGWPRYIGMFAIAVAIIAVGAGLRFWPRPPAVLRLNERGMWSRLKSSSGPLNVEWADVEDVRLSPSDSIVLSTGRGNVAFPLQLVGPDREKLLREIHQRLNDVNGYTRFEGLM